MPIRLSGRWTKLALVVSLALNLAVIGRVLDDADAPVANPPARPAARAALVRQVRKRRESTTTRVGTIGRTYAGRRCDSGV